MILMPQGLRTKSIAKLSVIAVLWIGITAAAIADWTCPNPKCPHRLKATLSDSVPNCPYCGAMRPTTKIPTVPKPGLKKPKPQVKPHTNRPSAADPSPRQLRELPPLWDEYPRPWSPQNIPVYGEPTRADKASFTRELGLKNAQAGQQGAMFTLGMDYLNGLSGPRDYANALKWLTKASSLGNVDSIKALRSIFDEGKGVARDRAKAMMYCRRAAEAGDQRNMIDFGRACLVGRDTRQDLSEALKQFRKAAHVGDINAFTELGWMYENGYGVPADKLEAVKWYKKAADSKFKYAVEAVKRLIG